MMKPAKDGCEMGIDNEKQEMTCAYQRKFGMLPAMYERKKRCTTNTISMLLEDKLKA